MPIPSDPDWIRTLEDRQQRRRMLTIAWGAFLGVALLGGVVFGGFRQANQPDSDPRCPGVLNLKPGQTVTISCPAVHP